jgi:hypothetical protein
MLQFGRYGRNDQLLQTATGTDCSVIDNPRMTRPAHLYHAVTDYLLFCQGTQPFQEPNRYGLSEMENTKTRLSRTARMVSGVKREKFADKFESP